MERADPTEDGLEQIDYTQLADDIQTSLKDALAADTTDMKNYHIRRALQYWDLHATADPSNQD